MVATFTYTCPRCGHIASITRDATGWHWDRADSHIQLFEKDGEVYSPGELQHFTPCGAPR